MLLHKHTFLYPFHLFIRVCIFVYLKILKHIKKCFICLSLLFFLATLSLRSITTTGSYIHYLCTWCPQHVFFLFVVTLFWELWHHNIWKCLKALAVTKSHLLWHHRTCWGVITHALSTTLFTVIIVGHGHYESVVLLIIVNRFILAGIYLTYDQTVISEV